MKGARKKLIWLLVLSGPALFGQEVDDPEETPSVSALEGPRKVLAQYPPFRARPRIPVLEDNGFYPCTDCHDGEFQLSNPRVRELEDMHEEIDLLHGGGRFWCLTCHHETQRDYLASLEGQPISLDEAFLLCGQCHFQRQQDFFFGGHGKRLDSWTGEKLVASCTECHDPHDPTIKPAVPFAPPNVRSGLSNERQDRHARPKPWETAAARRNLDPGASGEAEEPGSTAADETEKDPDEDH